MSPSSSSSSPLFTHSLAPEAWVHPTATVDEPCRIGPQTVIMAYTHVMGHVLLGANTHIASHVTLHSGVMVGHGVKVMAHCDVITGVVIEDDVYVGSHTTFAPKKRFSANAKAISQVNPTLLKQGAVIGPHATVACGLTLGEYCQILPYTLVEQAVPAYAIYGGSPARLVGWRCQCSQPLVLSVGVHHTTCGQCGTRYERVAPTQLVKLAPPTENTASAAMGA